MGGLCSAEAADTSGDRPISSAAPPLRLGELVATLALAQDNAFGQPLESQLRSCLLASWMCDAADVDRVCAASTTASAMSAASAAVLENSDVDLQLKTRREQLQQGRVDRTLAVVRDDHRLRDEDLRDLA